MPQSLAKIYVHLVFSTKNREPLLPEDVRADLSSFQDEFGAFLRRYAIEFDERYVWD
jgi:hypothetical protein